MKAIIQRVNSASILINTKTIAKIGKGYVIFLGIGDQDTEEKVINLSKEILRLQLFSDKNNKLTKTILETSGEILVVPQITLYANVKKGRIDFSRAEKPRRAKELFDLFLNELKKSKLKIKQGIFGAHMIVNIQNDGPVTVLKEV